MTAILQYAILEPAIGYYVITGSILLILLALVKLLEAQSRHR